jgi:exonuclease III
MSNSAKRNQTLKICGIAKLKSDIILLSDIRLSNRNLVSSANDMKTLFINNPYEKYDFYYNSSRNKRGVGVLLKTNKNFTVIDQVCSEDENILLLRVNLPGSDPHNQTEVIIVSVYGPNTNDPVFFRNLLEMLEDVRHLPIIVGGDWNATYCTENLNDNIDCLNMSRLPNASHSKKIAKICENFNLTDPFRFLYPDKIEFSYVPRAAGSINKSRIDFFIISDMLIDILTECEISTSLQNNLFDHKAVSVAFNNNRVKKEKINYKISNSDLNDDLLQILVHATIAETYLLSATDNIIAGQQKQVLLNTCGTVKNLIRECSPPINSILGLDPDPVPRQQRAKNNTFTGFAFLSKSTGI